MKDTPKKGRGLRNDPPKLSDRRSISLIQKLTGEGSPLSEDARSWLDGIALELVAETGTQDPETLRRAYVEAAQHADTWTRETKADSPHSFAPLAAVVSRVSAGEDAAAVVRELMDAAKERERAAGARQRPADPQEHLAAVASILVPPNGSYYNYDDDEEFRALAEILEWFVNEEDKGRRRDVADAILDATFKDTKAHFQLVYNREQEALKQTAARRVELKEGGAE